MHAATHLCVYAHSCTQAERLAKLQTLADHVPKPSTTIEANAHDFTTLKSAEQRLKVGSQCCLCVCVCMCVVARVYVCVCVSEGCVLEDARVVSCKCVSFPEMGGAASEGGTKVDSIVCCVQRWLVCANLAGVCEGNSFLRSGCCVPRWLLCAKVMLVEASAAFTCASS